MMSSSSGSGSSSILVVVVGDMPRHGDERGGVLDLERGSRIFF